MSSKIKPNCTCPPDRLKAGRPRLPRCGDNYPVLYIQTDYHNAKGDFDKQRIDECVRDRKCQVCGDPLEEVAWGIPNDNMKNAWSGFNQTALMHEGCLVLSVSRCPSLRNLLADDNVTVLHESSGHQYEAEEYGGRWRVRYQADFPWVCVHEGGKNSGQSVTVREVMGRQPSPAPRPPAQAPAMTALTRVPTSRPPEGEGLVRRWLRACRRPR